jgi:hypothetical protein
MAPLVTITPSANLCKILHNFVDICIRRQNFAELTPVHLWMTPIWQELFRRYSSWSLRSSVRPHNADRMSRGPQWLSADLVPIIVDGFEVRAQVRDVPIVGLSTGCHYVVVAPTNSCDRLVASLRSDESEVPSQTIHHCNVDVARGLVLLFGIGTITFAAVGQYSEQRRASGVPESSGDAFAVNRNPL